MDELRGGPCFGAIEIVIVFITGAWRLGDLVLSVVGRTTMGRENMVAIAMGSKLGSSAVERASYALSVQECLVDESLLRALVRECVIALESISNARKPVVDTPMTHRNAAEDRLVRLAIEFPRC
jgi:hypothetical protein